MADSEAALSRLQSNELFRAIQSAGMPIAEFELRPAITPMPEFDARANRAKFFGRDRDESSSRITRIPEHRVAAVSHSASDSLFAVLVKVETRTYACREYVANKRLTTDQVLKDLRSQAHSLGPPWGVVLERAAAWARAIGRWMAEEVYTPDLWEELLAAKRLFGAQSLRGSENALFDIDEQAEISKQIQQVKIYVKRTYELSTEQFSRVEARLDEADRASRRMGRKDWLMVFNGAVFSLVLSDLVPPSAAQNILVATVHGIGHMFGITPPLPPALPGG
jgi:hypothetical protein